MLQNTKNHRNVTKILLITPDHVWQGTSPKRYIEENKKHKLRETNPDSVVFTAVQENNGDHQ